MGSVASREEVEAFIAENNIDERCGKALLAEGPDVQTAIIDRGSLCDCVNPSAALMGRIRDVKKSTSNIPLGLRSRSNTIAGTMPEQSSASTSNFNSMASLGALGTGGLGGAECMAGLTEMPSVAAMRRLAS